MVGVAFICCTFVAKIKCQYSTEVDLKFSVPQGSCAGPTLYLAYASTIQEIIPKNIDIHKTSFIQVKKMMSLIV